jgi:Na+/H+-dicarboxylate symporter
MPENKPRKNIAFLHPLEELKPESLKQLSKKLQKLLEGKLYAKVLLGMFLGIFVGILLGPDTNLVNAEAASLITEWLAFPGTIFIKAIQMIVIPLIFASVINGIAASENINQLKKTGTASAIFFVITTIIAILIGIGLALAINPGQYVSSEVISQAANQGPSAVAQFEAPTLKNLPNVISTILPVNIFGSLVNGQMLQIVIFSMIIGIAIVNLRIDQSKPLIDLLTSVQSVCMTIVKWSMLLAPIAVFGLMTKVASTFGLKTLLGIGVYVLTVLAGLLLMLIVYMVIVLVTSKTNPFTFLKSIREVQLLAFSTSSSAAVMPLTIKTAEEKLNVSSSVSQFVVPIGATINMNGTALYQAVATIFLAQVFNVNLGLTALILLIATIVGASIGSPATPGVGIAILALILSSMGVPLAGLALILGVDRILDMSRTAINVSGDLTACMFIDRFIGGKKQKNS